jgi:hypothetical protein
LTAEGPGPAVGDREKLLRKKNRAALLWLTAILLAIAGAGFAFGRWLLAHPPKSMH